MKAYSVDLREKIVAAVRRGMSKAQVARTFGVSATSVKRYVKLAEEGNSLTPGKAPGKQSKLGASGMRLLEEDLRARPTASAGRKAKRPLRCRASSVTGIRSVLPLRRTPTFAPPVGIRKLPGQKYSI